MSEQQTFTSEAITRGLRVAVESVYDPQRSRPHGGLWFFLYTVTLTNHGGDTVQLLGRHWVVTDATGRIEEVEGEGVIGQQPVLAPGESFEYTSGCPLLTSCGSMHGTYRMVVLESGEQYDATIAPFTLSVPYTVN